MYPEMKCDSSSFWRQQAVQYSVLRLKRNSVLVLGSMTAAWTIGQSLFGHDKSQIVLPDADKFVKWTGRIENAKSAATKST